MKKSGLLTLCAALLFILLVSPAYAQRETRYLQGIVIEDFDDPEESRWTVTGSKFITAEYPKYAWVRAWPDALYRREPEGRELRSLGVEAKFDRLGYNYLEFMPLVEDEDGELVPGGIPLPGQVQEIDMWVWGSNYDYYIEVHLEDFRGITHVLPLGNINYRGWRNLSTRVPTHIPQTVRFVPQHKGLELVKIVLWTRPTERVDGFYVYLDEIKILTDTFRDRFDGEDLGDPEMLEEIWAEATGR